MNKKQISREDILAYEDYVKVRSEKRKASLEVKKDRRVAVGPYAMFYFENFDTMVYQVQEMVYIEKGGDEQLVDELATYNPLIPQGNELVATVMFEIPNPAARKQLLGSLGGVEETFYIEIAGKKIVGIPEVDVDRTNADGKASSVQFAHFVFDAASIAAFKDSEAQVSLGISHEAYAHSTQLTGAVRAALSKDFD